MKALLRIIILLMVIFPNKNIYSQKSTNSTEDNSRSQQKSNLTFLLGPQFNETINSKTSMIVGLSFDLYRKEEISPPLEFLLHYMRAENFNDYVIFPRAAVNLKYNLIKIGTIDIYLQTGIGIPFLFPYIFDFSPIFGFSYKKIKIDIRNIFYFDFGSGNNFGISRWPMVAVILGLSI